MRMNLPFPSMQIIYNSKVSSAADTSGPQHLLHHVTRHVVEEQSQNGQQQESSDDLDGQPPVLVAHQVFCSFKGDEEPEEGNVWTAGETQKQSVNSKENSHLG